MIATARIVGGYVLAEAVRRRTFMVIGVIASALVVLYGWGAWVAFRAAGEVIQIRGLQIDGATFVGNQLSGVAIFGELFLGAVMAVLLSQAAIRGDAEQGLLQPIVARPVGRVSYMAIRFGVVALFCAGFVVAAYASITLITGLVGDWWPPDVIRPGIYLALAIIVVTAITTASSVLLSMTANGIAVFLVFGAALANGMLIDIGTSTRSEALTSTATAVSWALPFEPLYQAAVAAASEQADGIAGQLVAIGPFSGGREPSSWLLPWSVLYTAAIIAGAAAIFRRRDL